MDGMTTDGQGCANYFNGTWLLVQVLELLPGAENKRGCHGAANETARLPSCIELWLNQLTLKSARSIIREMQSCKVLSRHLASEFTAASICCAARNEVSRHTRLVVGHLLTKLVPVLRFFTSRCGLDNSQREGTTATHVDGCNVVATHFVDCHLDGCVRILCLVKQGLRTESSC